MKKLTQRIALAATTLALLAGCAGTPVSLGTPVVAGKIPTGESRSISAEACGFQLFLLIPIGINGRLESAYSALQAQAGGDFITDVEVQERWSYGFVGTRYCTELRAKAVRAR
jgi:hypothetical protein